MSLNVGVILQNGKYIITRVLGQGGFGITYEAEQVALHRRVAIKEFFMKDYCEREETTNYVTLGTSSGSKDLVEKFRTKFIREAQMIAGQDHPGIVKIFDVFEENGTAYYVMEFLEGGSLTDLVKKSGPLPEAQAVEYIHQVGDALSHLHNQNCLHFDVKPSNILLNREGKAVLIDFGISKHYDEAGSQTSSTPVGISKGYAPLEQYQQSEISNFTPATDIYALGATFYFLLTGQTPPSASEVNEDGLPPFPVMVSDSTKRAIIKAMSPRRKDRPQSINSFGALLDVPSQNGKDANKDGHSTRDIEMATDNGSGEETIINEHMPEELVSKPEDNVSSRRKTTSRGIKWLVGAIIAVLTVILVIVLIPRGESPTSSVTKEDSITINGSRVYSFSFGSKGDNEQFYLDKNFSEGWTYTQMPDWCAIYPGSTIFTVVCEENTSTNSRSAVIQFSKKGSEIILATLKIYQEAATPVVIKASSISMQSTGYIEGNVGESFNIEYTIKPAAAKNHKVTWSSSDKTVATVSSDGTITAKGNGNTTIYAKVDDVSAKCNLVVKITPSPSHSTTSYNTNTQDKEETIYMNVGDSKFLKINGNVPDKLAVYGGNSVTVNPVSGYVSAVRPGVTSISGWYDGQIKRFSIHVR